jgi:hypothetical protein
MMRCPVCAEIYSYGRQISHICGEKIFLFGSIFSEKKENYQWNCYTGSVHKSTNKRTKRSHTSGDTKNFDEIDQELTHKKSYDWNCDTVQNIPNIIFDLKESPRILLYE